jgi:hypothetical protein
MDYLTNQYDRGEEEVALIALYAVTDLHVIKFTDSIFSDGHISHKEKADKLRESLCLS